MGRTIKQSEPDQTPGAPQWMVTFCDCMTLMLTFFVLLFSFSSFDVEVFEKLAMTFTKALSDPNPLVKRDKSAFLSTEQVAATGELGEGSEKPTVETGWQEEVKEDTEPGDFHSRKVFLIPSNNIFWGKGIAISSEGHKILATMASFLRETPSRIVICESGPADDEGFGQLGLPRAWAVVNYLTRKQGLNKAWFSISATSTVTEQSFEHSRPGQRRRKAERGLEIVLLERSIYN